MGSEALKRMCCTLLGRASKCHNKMQFQFSAPKLEELNIALFKMPNRDGAS